MIKIFLMPLETNIWTDEDAALLKYLPDTSAEIVLRFKHDEDRRLSLYSELLYRWAIKEALACSYSSVEIAYPYNLKPYITNPVSSGLDFNIGHTTNAIICGISDEGAIGVDIENVNKRAPYIVMPRVFHSEEIAYINRDEESKKQHFFECWTRKEAYTKQIGTGLNAPLTTFNTFSAEMDATIITRKIDDYICSVSVAGEHPSLHEIDFEIIRHK